MTRKKYNSRRRRGKIEKSILAIFLDFLTAAFWRAGTAGRTVKCMRNDGARCVLWSRRGGKLLGNCRVGATQTVATWNFPDPPTLLFVRSLAMHKKSFRETREGANVTDDIKEPSAASPHLSVQRVPSRMPGEGFFHRG